MMGGVGDGPPVGKRVGVNVRVGEIVEEGSTVGVKVGAGVGVSVGSGVGVTVGVGNIQGIYPTTEVGTICG